jgi:hypothetical protein
MFFNYSINLATQVYRKFEPGILMNFTFIKLCRVSIFLSIIAIGFAGCSGSGGGDPVHSEPLSAPGIKVNFPTLVSLTDTPSISVTGTAETGTVMVRVNGTDAVSDDGFATWRVENLALNAGENTLAIEIEDENGTITQHDNPLAVHYAGPLLISPAQITVDTTNNQLLVLDNSRLVGIDLQTGWRSIVSSNDVGSGPQFFRTKSMFFDTNNNRAMVLQYNEALLAVDPANGTRSYFSEGQGIVRTFVGPKKLATDPVNQRAYFIDSATTSLMEVNLVDGVTHIISGQGQGTGASINIPTAVALSADNQDLYVLTNSPDSIVKVNVASGEGVIVSDNTFPGTASFTNQDVDIALDAANNRLIVLKSSNGTIFSVSLTDGGRTLISDNSGTFGGPDILGPHIGMAFDAGNSRVFIGNQASTGNIWAVDLNSGDRSLVTDGLDIDSSLSLAKLQDMVVNSAQSLLYVVDSNKRLVSVDLTAQNFANLTSISDASLGAGISMGTPVDVGLDATAGNMLVLSEVDQPQLIRVDISNGNRTLVAGNTLATEFVNAVDAAFDATNSLVLVVDRDLQSLIGADLITGQRTPLSNAGIGTGDFIAPVSIAADTGGLNALMLSSEGDLYSVELASGNRTLLTNKSATVFNYRGSQIAIAQDTENNRTLVLDKFNDALIAEKDDGSRELISAFNRGTGEYFYNPVDFVLHQGKAYVADSGHEGVVTVDLTSGDRSLLGEVQFGEGDEFNGIAAAALDQTQQRLLLVEEGMEGLFAIDFASGNRTLISSFDAGVGSGIALYNPTAVVYDAASNRALVANWDNDLIAVDMASGDRSMISDYTGLDPSFISAMALDQTNERVLIVDRYNGALIAIQLADGTRHVISGVATGAGPDITYPTGLYLDNNSEVPRALILDQDTDSIVSVDLASGGRSIVSDSTHYNYDYDLDLSDGGFGLAMDAAGNRLFATKDDFIIAIDLVDGNRSIVSGLTNGTGVSVFSPVGLVFDPAFGRLYVVDQWRNAVIVINPLNGDRAIVSKCPR